MYVACKIFDNDSEIEARKEIHLYKNLNHDNLIKILDNFVIDYKYKDEHLKYHVIIFPLFDNFILHRHFHKHQIDLYFRNILSITKYLHEEKKLFTPI